MFFCFCWLLALRTSNNETYRAMCYLNVDDLLCRLGCQIEGEPCGSAKRSRPPNAIFNRLRQHHVSINKCSPYAALLSIVLLIGLRNARRRREDKP